MPPKRKARKPADAIDLTEMASPQEKKQKVALTTIAKEFVCPITQELPISPVTAEDGKIYEEKAIREWFSKKDGEPTSPSTGAVIGTRLLPAPQARNTIEALVESGAIEGEIAEAWKQKLELETLVIGLLKINQLESQMVLQEIPKPVVMVEAVVQVVLESLVVILVQLVATTVVVELVVEVEPQDLILL